MQVILSARNCELTDDLRELAQDRLDSLERFEPRASRVEVMITGERVRYRAEALISVAGGERVHARAEGPDARTAIDQVAEKLGKQLRRSHERRRDHHAPPLGEMGLAGAGAARPEGVDAGAGPPEGVDVDTAASDDELEPSGADS